MVRILLECILVYYRPQRSCGQGYVFTRVCDSVHRGVSGEPPRTRQTRPPPPQDQGEPPQTRQTPPRDQGEPPRTRENPPGPGRPPKDQGEHPPWEEDCSIWSMSSRYASYWNAFLFCLRFSASAFTYGREKKSVTLLYVKEMFLSLTIIEKSCTGCQLIYYCIIRLCHRQRVLASNFFRVRYRL